MAIPRERQRTTPCLVERMGIRVQGRCALVPETGDRLPGPNTVIVAGWVAAPRPQHLQKRHSRINLTDPEARVMKGRHQAWWYRGIVASWLDTTPRPWSRPGRRKREPGACWSLQWTWSVVDEVNDNALLTPMMEPAEDTTRTKSQMTLADAGYYAASHLAECDRRGQQVVVPESRQRILKDPYHRDRFIYDGDSDTFRCPQGQTLEFVRIQHVNGVPLRL